MPPIQVRTAILAALFSLHCFSQPAPPSHPVYGIDFSPYLTGQSPRHRTQISAAQIEARLKIVAPFTRWIRTFGSTNGLEATAAIARTLGLKVAVQAWIGRDKDANKAEIANVIAAANAGNADIVIVGSEVFYRGDVSEDELLNLMAQVRAAIPASIPVTTAEIYDRLNERPRVIAASDIVLGNIYPYWERVPVTNAVCSLAQKYQLLKSAAGSKQVIIAETGWPSGGNTVGRAVPSPANAALYFKQFVTWAAANNIPYFYFEAFNEAWKVDEEGPQGAHWGIWDESGSMKPGMAPVFSGDTAPVACDGPVDGPGTPAIQFVYVPPYGNTSDRLQGQVRHVVPSTHRVLVYIKVGAGWWTKPTFASPATTIENDGAFSAAITTGGSDQLATEIAAFLVPATFSPPLASGGALPASLSANALAQVSIQRTERSISGKVTDPAGQPVGGVQVDAAGLGAALSAIDGNYSFFNIASAGTFVLTPAFPNYVFTPASMAVTVGSTNQFANFRATPTVDLSISSSLAPPGINSGSSFTHTVVVGNAGIGSATSATATLTYPTALALVSASTTRGSCSVSGQIVTCALGSLAPTATADITVSGTAAAIGAHTVSASVDGPDPDLNRSNNTTAATLNVSCTFTTTTVPATVAAERQTLLIAVSTQPGCAWSASSNRSWAQVFPLNAVGSGSIDVTVFPNFGVSTRSVTLNLAGTMAIVNQTGMTGNANQRFVHMMYFSFFGRAPSPAEVAFMESVLLSGLPRPDFVVNFMNSAEFNNGGRFIAGLYAGILNRNAEYGGWLFTRNALATGIVAQAQLVSIFLESGEFKLNHPALTNRQLAALMYRQILSREGTPAELDFMQGVLDRNELSRPQFVTNFLNSHEFRLATGPRITAFLLYATLLQRDPSPAEYGTVVAELQSGVPPREIIERLLFSAEFTAQFN